MTNPRRAHLGLMSSHRLSPLDDPDFYPTPPWGARAGAELVRRLDPRAASVADPACGSGTMAHGLSEAWPGRVWASDAYDYGWGHALFDFTAEGPLPYGEVDWLITNPPFVLAETFIRKGLERARRGVALLMRGAAWESDGRYHPMFGGAGLPGVTAWAPFSERLPMFKGRYDPEGSSAAFYAWFLWFKSEHHDRRTPQGRPTWAIPPGTRARLTRRSDLRFAALPAGSARRAGIPGLTEAKLTALRRLADHPQGSGAVRGLMDGAHLASLVQFGLAERLPPDRIGGNRYGVSAGGVELLLELGGVG